ncbi:vomeronasal type-2 receptor 26-like, partial [Pelobates cultripes]
DKHSRATTRSSCLFQLLFCVLLFCMMPSQIKNQASFPACNLRITEPYEDYEYFKDGDIIIGGIFTFVYSFHPFGKNTGPTLRLGCALLNEARSILLSEIEVHKEYIINNKRWSPNITLGYHFFDSCAHPVKAVKSVFQILSGLRKPVPNYSCRDYNKVAGFIGDLHSVTTIPIAQILGVYRYLQSQISYGATDYTLTDRLQYPHVFRIIPNDCIYYAMLVTFLKYFKWNWVGILYPDDVTGETESQYLTDYMASKDICVAFRIKSYIGFHKNQNFERIKQMMQTSDAKIIIICGSYTVHTLSMLFLLLEKVYDMILIISTSYLSSIERRQSQVFNGSFTIVPSTLNYSYPLKRFTLVHPSIYPEDKLLEHIWILLKDCKKLPDAIEAAVQVSKGKNVHSDQHATSMVMTGDGSQVATPPNVPLGSHAIRSPPMTCGSPPMTGRTCSLRRLTCLSGRQVANKVLYLEAAKITCFYSRCLVFVLPLGGFRLSAGKTSLLAWYTDRQALKECLPKLHEGPHPERPMVPWTFSKSGGNYANGNLKTVLRGPVGGGRQRCLRECDRALNTLYSVNGTHSMYQNLKSLIHRSRVPKSQCSENCVPGYRKAPGIRTHICCYNCVPCSEGEISNRSDSETCIKCPDTEWPNKKKKQCFPKLEEFLSYSNDVLAVIFFSISSLFIVITVVTLVIFIFYQDTPIVKANNKNLSLILLVSILLSFLCVFLFLGRPVDITCILRQTSFGIIFSIAVSCILTKTVMVFIAFSATKPGSSWKRCIGVKQSNLLVAMFSSIQVLINIIWLAISPPFQELDLHSYPGKIIIQCNEGSVIAFYSVLGYMGILAAVSFIVAFLARTLPDSFNEAKCQFRRFHLRSRFQRRFKKTNPRSFFRQRYTTKRTSRYNKSQHQRRQKSRPIRRGKRNWKKYKPHGQTTQDEEITVFNLSNKILNSDHYSLLNKALSFVPVAKPDLFQTEVELYKIQRILYSNEIKKHPTKKPTHVFPMKNKRDIRTANSSIKAFIQTVKMDIEKIVKNPPLSHQNLSPGEKAALKDLSQDPNIVIRGADKGGATVIQSYDQYRKEILRQLSDTSVYTKLTFDPTAKFQKRIKNHVELGLQLEYLDTHTAQYLTVEHPRYPPASFLCYRLLQLNAF